jgi:hypothetical protein
VLVHHPGRGLKGANLSVRTASALKAGRGAKSAKAHATITAWESGGPSFPHETRVFEAEMLRLTAPHLLLSFISLRSRRGERFALRSRLLKPGFV